MKKSALILFLCLPLLVTACKKIKPADLFADSHTATYMDWIDAEKVAQTLHKSADRQSVKWENPLTGYQYSAFVLKTAQKDNYLERKVTLLTISPEGQGESLDLVGRTKGGGVWHVYAEKHASPVGKVLRETLMVERTPPGPEWDFAGYPVLSLE
ncbi:hypothetical protein [Salidesulfovibrio onnuriiensis]|uniref:hypothetical protein n=1 Tax=Salidesulfovibrio onnuriiensis TaxID=2583823 RepID=UPI0011CCD0D1|nr:hypothetical protein [Salidesulfovibrio onnuriiensis]